jgi:putative DNA primase/helicase
MSDTPTHRPFDFEAAPDSMLVERRWINWKLIQRPGKAKPDKVPFQPQNGQMSDCGDPSKWATWREAVEGVRRWNMTGISFALGGGWVGVDVDHSVENGVLSPLAQSVVQQLGGYAEISPSGTGVHVIVRGEMPGEHGRKTKFVEMYGNKRFLTYTGWWIGDRTPDAEGYKPAAPEPARIPPAEMKAFYDLHFPPAAPVNRAGAVGFGLGLAAFGGGGSYDGRELDPSKWTDGELIHRIRASRQGAKFEALFEGDWRAYYSSQSEADAALCSLLNWWTRQDAGRVDRLFRQSKLFRPKWDERRGAETYGQRTIRKTA